MYTHTVNFLNEESVEEFAHQFDIKLATHFKVEAHHSQVVNGQDIFGMELTCATFHSDCRIGQSLGICDAGGNAIETLPKADKERFGVQSASLNQ